MYTEKIQMGKKQQRLKKAVEKIEWPGTMLCKKNATPKTPRKARCRLIRCGLFSENMNSCMVMAWYSIKLLNPSAEWPPLVVKANTKLLFNDEWHSSSVFSQTPNRHVNSPGIITYWRNKKFSIWQYNNFKSITLNFRK